MRNNQPVTRPRSTSSRRYSFRPMVGMFIFLFTLMLTLTSCKQDSPTQSSATDLTTDKSSTLTDGVAISDGIPGADSSAALFTIDYGMQVKPGAADDGTGEARAIAFSTSTGATSEGKRAGIDIGTVTLTAGSQSLTLQKLTDRRGTAYSLRGKPGSETGTGVAYAGGASYQFAVSGSADFSAATFSITAPSARLAFSSLTEGQTVSKSSDLTIAWSGGNTTTGALLRIMPAPPKPDSMHQGHPEGGMGGGQQGGRGPGGPGQGGPGMGDGGRGHGGPGQGGPGMGGPGMDGRRLDSTHVVIVRLASNNGTYTVTSAQLQAIINGLPTSDIVISVSQLTSTTATHDGKQVRVAFHDDAHVKVSLQ